MMPFAVSAGRPRFDGVPRMRIVGRGELARWPMHGLVKSMAWQFDGTRLRLVWIGRAVDPLATFQAIARRSKS